jgi:hypothetical protein
LTSAETLGDLLERSLLELTQQDDLAVIGSQCFDGRFEPFGSFAEHDAAHRRGDLRGHLQRCVIQRRLTDDVAAATPVKIRLVADLVLRNSGEPRHQTRHVRAAQLLNLLKRFQQRGLQDIARFDLRTQRASHFQSDQREQSWGAAAEQGIQGDR